MPSLRNPVEFVREGASQRVSSEEREPFERRSKSRAAAELLRGSGGERGEA